MKINASWVDSTDQAKLRVYKFECREQGFEHRPNDSTRPNLLFSHANGFHGRCFDPIIESLCGEFDCTSFDLRGHGDSVARADGSVVWQGSGDDALCVARSLPPGRVAVGLSMGGAALVMGARRAPEICRAVMLFVAISFAGDMRSVAANQGGAG
ncbi:MAG: alpha/beta hydrolase, partial [Actinomycetota bacterium]